MVIPRCKEIRSDSIKHPSRLLNGNLTFLFKIRWKCCQKKPLPAQRSILSQHFGQIYLSHISNWTQPLHFSISSIQGSLQFLQVERPSSSSTLHPSFHDSAKFLYSCDGPGYCSSWCISSLTTVLDGIFFPLPSFRFLLLVHLDICALLGNCSLEFPQISPWFNGY